MPIYVYKCPRCGYTFENVELSKDEKAPECNHCKILMEKQMSASTSRVSESYIAGQGTIQ